MVFSKFAVQIREEKGKQKLKGEAAGEALDIARHAAKEEVKGATYSQLKVEKAASGKHAGKWIAQCIVDV
jgi:SHS2 domain-containing protein